MTTEQKLQAKIDFLIDEIRWRDNGNAAMTFRQRLAYQCYYEKNGNFLLERLSPKLCWVPDSWEPPTYSRTDIEEDEEEEEEDECASCGTTCLDHTSNKGRGSESPCSSCEELRCKHCPCECDEEEEEEELHICGMTGREFDKANPHTGCGVAIKEDDDNIMIGNISFCIACAERETEEDEEETISCRSCKKEFYLWHCEYDHCDECFNDKFKKWLEDNGYEDGRWVNNKDRTDNHKIEEDFYLVLDEERNQ